MNRRRSKSPKSLICLLILFGTAWLLQPSTALAAKTLASEALAAAIRNGTLDQVRQEILMDLSQKQRFDFDEQGMEELGRNLAAKGQMKHGVEVLQLNQMIHSDSPGAANALGDIYRDSGNDLSARIYYDMALNLDPENAHARKATADQGSAQELAMEAMANAGGMGDWELDPEAMAQMGVELSPEQIQEMQEAMAQMEAYQQDTGALRAAEAERATRQGEQVQQGGAATSTAQEHESEYCEVLHRFNGRMKIKDSQVRTRVEGHYGAPGDTLRTWNVESACGEFLIAVPLWADVSPPLMGPVTANQFEDIAGGWWVFEFGGDGKATGVTYTPPKGRTTAMKRLGDPKSLD